MACYKFIGLFSPRGHVLYNARQYPLHLIGKTGPGGFLSKTDCKSSSVLVRPVVPAKQCPKTINTKTIDTNIYRSNFQNRWFHLSTRKQAIPPLIWTFVNFGAKLGAIFTGRSARKWLKAQPKEVRRKYLKFLLIKLACWLVGGSAVGMWYYKKHLQEAPVTHRKRFISLTPEQYLKVADFETETYMNKYKEDMLPGTHPYCEIVVNIARRLVAANQDFPGMSSHKWTIWIVRNKDKNAFVLPNGNVFVFTGLIEFVNNEDQLAMVIGHEMAHALMLHAAEQLSYSQLLDYSVIAVMAAIWAVMPSDGIAVVTQWFYNKVMQLSVHMPYSRQLEKEADIVGLQLASKACFDVREGSVFWGKMDIASDIENSSIPEWLSTHPSHGNRVELFDFLLPKALEMREKSNCPRLPECDPRDQIKKLRYTVDNIKVAQKAKVNLQKVQKVKPQGFYPILNRGLADSSDNSESGEDSVNDDCDQLRKDSDSKTSDDQVRTETEGGEIDDSEKDPGFTLSLCLREEKPKCDLVLAGNDSVSDKSKDKKNVMEKIDISMDENKKVEKNDKSKDEKFDKSKDEKSVADKIDKSKDENNVAEKKSELAQESDTSS